jgi:hypothetical protein
MCAEGLQGPPDGLRALHYEYCIPHRQDAVEEVTAIDPTLTIQRGSPGRIGCADEELLCLGHTHQPGFRAVLEQLAALPMVREIPEAFFEKKNDDGAVYSKRPGLSSRNVARSVHRPPARRYRVPENEGAQPRHDWRDISR